MAEAGIALVDQGPERMRSRTSRNYCISFGFQRHAYFVLRAVSVFYFASKFGNPGRGQQFHSFLFAILALAPVCVGALVTTLQGQRRAVYVGELLLIAAFALVALDANLYLAIASLAVGIGLFNISFKTVSSNYIERLGDQSDVYFTRLYPAINVASFLAPLVVSHIFRYTPNTEALTPPGRSIFVWCSVCMLVSMYFWWSADHGQRAGSTSKADHSQSSMPGDSRADRTKIFGVLTITFFGVLFWLGFLRK
jgi:dipeptide/tripeptide permease